MLIKAIFNRNNQINIDLHKLLKMTNLIIYLMQKGYNLKMHIHLLNYLIIIHQKKQYNLKVFGCRNQLIMIHINQ
jgi:hypothetical protein